MLTEGEKRVVRKRANFRCEYCKAPENVTAYAFHMEHILPRSLNKIDELSNYALACIQCNLSKSDHLLGKDPRTGKLERLFNPRIDRWSEHFTIRKKIHIAGKTALGRATVDRLAMNSSRQIEARQLWAVLELFP